MSLAEKRKKKMESKLLLQARRSILSEIDKLENERCELCKGPTVTRSTSNCDCRAAVKVRELGHLLNRDKEEVLNVGRERLLMSEIKKLTESDFTVEKYNGLKKLGLTDRKIVIEIGWHANKLNNWKRENGLVRSQGKKENVPAEIMVEVNPVSPIKSVILDTVGLLIDKQIDKGIKKYGQSLEACEISAFDWNVMIQEELIDALQYQQKEIIRLTAEKSLTLNAYLKQSERTAEPHDNELLNYGLGISEEAGEVSGIIKKCFFHGHEIDKTEVKKELGDVLWYLSQIARLAGLTLEEVATANIEKLQKRYPNGFSQADSIHRAE